MPPTSAGILPYASVDSRDEAGDFDCKLGGLVTLPLPTLQGAPVAENWGPYSQSPEVDLVWARWAEPQHVTLVLQTRTPPNALDTALRTGVYIKILTALGGSAKFFKKFRLAVGPPTTLRLFGRGIVVSAFAVDQPTGVPLVVAGALTLGDTNPLAEMVACWVGGPSTSLGGTRVGEGQITPGAGSSLAGYLLGFSGYVWGTMTAGQNYYLQIFDLAPGATIPSGAGGATPLVEVGPLVGPGPVAFSFDRSLRPSVRFQNGLMWGLSNQPGIYSAANVFTMIQADYGL